jgi:hypothetical protein
MQAKTILVRLLGVSTIGAIALSSSGCVELALIAALAGDNDTAVETDPTVTGRIPTDEYYYMDTESTIDFDYNSLSGSLGSVSEFEGGIYQQTGYQYGEVASIQVDAQNADENWALMALLTVEGGIDHPDLVPGATFTFNYDDYYGSYDPADADRLYVSLLGCQGSEPGYWDYDRSANEVTLTVEQGVAPEERVFNYTATWDDGSEVNGSVTLR